MALHICLARCTHAAQVFRPPNPWVMAILALLVEVYNLDNIKTGLKFEVGAWTGARRGQRLGVGQLVGCMP